MQFFHFYSSYIFSDSYFWKPLSTQSPWISIHNSTDNIFWESSFIFGLFSGGRGETCLLIIDIFVLDNLSPFRHFAFIYFERVRSALFSLEFQAIGYLFSEVLELRVLLHMKDSFQQKGHGQQCGNCMGEGVGFKRNKW